MTSNSRPWALTCALNLCAVFAATGCASMAEEQTETSMPEHAARIHFLEIVTPDVAATCTALEKVHGLSFGEPVPEFGNARTMSLHGGGRISVRAPMRETEQPVVRPYALVEDIDAAVEAAQAAGAVIALPPMEIPGQGKFAIYILGGIEHGLWKT